MSRRLEALERMAEEKAREFDRLYLRVPKARRRQAYKLFLAVANGEITYEEALERLRELAGD